MVHITHDRAEIIDFIGRQSGSPALLPDGSPTFVIGHGGSEAKRVAWPAFFAAVNARKLAMRFDTESGEWKWVPRGHEEPSPGQVSTDLPPDHKA